MARPLNNALKKALSAFGKPPDVKPVEFAFPPINPVEVSRIYEPSRKEIVAGGDIKWKPVDKQARMMLSKSPWWAHPPTESNLKDSKPKNKNNMSESPKTPRGTMHPGIHNQLHVEEHGNDALNADLSKRFIRDTSQALDKTKDLLDKAIDARAAMDDLCDSWKVSWIDFQKTCDDRLRECRMTRSALEFEMRNMMTGFRDIRAFFLDEKHDRQVERLKEFIGLCERLKALKESGFLDTVADTILKLENA